MTRPRGVERQSILGCDLRALVEGAFDRLDMCAGSPTTAMGSVGNDVT